MALPTHTRQTCPTHDPAAQRMRGVVRTLFLAAALLPLVVVECWIATPPPRFSLLLLLLRRRQQPLLSASLQRAVLLATAEGDAAGALHTRELSDTAGSRTEAQSLDATMADDAVRRLHSQDIEQYRQQTGIEDYESVYNALEAASWDVAVAVCAFWDSLAAPASPLQPATHTAGACQHTSSYVSIRQLLRKCGALSSSSCACLLC
jgi:NACalpha-BTF3-like transcription factor